MLDTEGLSLQNIFEAAIIISETEMIGCKSCLRDGHGRGFNTEWLDRALSITKHIMDNGDMQALISWMGTTDDEKERWPRRVKAFWRRVPGQAINDMVPIAAEIIF